MDADLDKAVKVRVIFTDNRSHQETLTSAATAAVEPRPNSPATGAPTISGTVRVGETLTAETSAIADADGMSGAVFSYQWLANGADVAGATSDTYTLVDADQGKAVKVRVIFNDDDYNEETLTSEATAAVEPRPSSPATGAPTISGTVRVGETLTADTSGIDDADGMSRAVFSYQWLANGAETAGATSDTYALVADDVGKAIKVKVSFRDDRNHQESLTSAATAAVTAAADESAVWSATLTVGSIAGYRGFWKDIGMGDLTSEVFTLDGVDYTVKVLADSDGPQFYLTLDKALPVGFTLQVGATTLSSQGASIREFSSGATQYGWATNQEAVLADVDTVEVSLTLAYVRTLEEGIPKSWEHVHYTRPEVDQAEAVITWHGDLIRSYAVQAASEKITRLANETITMLREKREKVQKEDGSIAALAVIARMGKAELRTDATKREQVIDLLVTHRHLIPVARKGHYMMMVPHV